MTEKTFEPLEMFMIEDLETLRVMSDPLRTQIYEMLLPQQASVRQLADRLGLAPSRLYYHINLLEKFNLIRMVDTRMISNIQEKFYRAVAFRLDVAPNLLDFQTEEGKTSIAELVKNTLDVTREDLLRSLQARTFVLEQGAEVKPRRMVMTRQTARIPDNLADEFHARLEALVKEFGDKDTAMQEGDEYVQYAMMVAFYPSFYYEEPGERDRG